jgi:YHS domain-containing protein
MVMKRIAYPKVRLAVFFVVLGIMFAPSMQAGEKGKAQTMCPIMGGQIDKTAYVDYEGKRVYFCCTGCKSTFLKEPEKHVKKMESEGIVLETAPVSKK